MSDTVRFAGPLQSMLIEEGYDPIGWVVLTGEAAEAVAAHELVRRMETGKRRGFGSVKVTARISESRWQTSLFPQKTAAGSCRSRSRCGWPRASTSAMR